MDPTHRHIGACRVPATTTGRTRHRRRRRCRCCCRGTINTLLTVAREEGAASLFRGIVPGLHRQVLLGGVRIASCAYSPHVLPLPIDVTPMCCCCASCLDNDIKCIAAFHGKAHRHHMQACSCPTASHCPHPAPPRR